MIVTAGAGLAALAMVAVTLTWFGNYRSAGNAPDATRQTSRRVVAVVSGAVLAVAIAIAELAGVVGVIGEVVSMFPGGVTQLVLSGLAVAGFAGYIEISVVGFTALIVLVLVGSTALRG